MFQLIKVEDILILEPYEITQQTSEILFNKIQQQYLFKPTPLGLCVSIHNYQTISTKLAPSSANAQVKLFLSLLVFQLQLDELIIGTIKAANSEGLIINTGNQSHLQLGIIDIFLPGMYLNSPAYYDKNNNQWFWNYQGHQLIYKLNQTIKIKGYKMLEQPVHDCWAIAKTNEDGLGPVQWWVQNNQSS